MAEHKFSGGNESLSRTFNGFPNYVFSFGRICISLFVSLYVLFSSLKIFVVCVRSHKFERMSRFLTRP